MDDKEIVDRIIDRAKSKEKAYVGVFTYIFNRINYLFDKIADSLQERKYAAFLNKSKMLITIPNGSVIKLFSIESLSDSNKYKGIRFDFVILDEKKYCLDDEVYYNLLIRYRDEIS